MRFKGWTMKDIEKIQRKSDGLVEEVREVPTQRKCVPKNRDYVGEISSALKTLGVEHQTEYKFLHDRRFRFDIAIPEKMLAIEFEGGIFSGGRHTRGAGYAKDAKKYNLAVRYGWKLLRYTSADASGNFWEYKIAQEIKDILG